MSGLEALGIVCLMMQVITFARDTSSVCMAVYKGQQTPDAAFEDKAVTVRTWAADLKAKSSTVPAEKELQSLAEKCNKTADALASEMQKITKYHKSSSVFRAVKASLASTVRHRRIEELDHSLAGYMSTLQYIMTQQNYYRAKAIEIQQKEGFGKTDASFQHFIGQIVAGHTDIQDLVVKEHVATRQQHRHHIETAAQAIVAYIDQSTSQANANEALQKQYDRLLKSLKSSTMKKRENEVMEPRDATVTRIFKAYDQGAYRILDEEGTERLSDRSMSDDNELHEIDAIWQGFLDWLHTESDMYWISGIPGSGKSTLVKFVTHHKGTMELLQLWRPSVMILTHFFWKIGSAPQNDLKGLLTSLAYQLLDGNLQLVKLVMTAPTTGRLGSKEHYNDWSVPELEELLELTLRLHPSSVCIFIDGLDEFVDIKNGPESLMKFIQKLSKNEKTKICVSSRPEPRLKRVLAGYGSMELQDLTKPDMRVFLYQRFSDVEMSEYFGFSIINELLTKAQGSFLWIHLASKSLWDGMQNGDSEDMIEKRLHALPPELDELYADMWKRLNRDEPIYRTAAAGYLLLMISMVRYGQMWMQDLEAILGGVCMLHMMFANEPALEDDLLEDRCLLTLDEAIRRCEKLQRSIQVQCAGLLDIKCNKNSPWREHPEFAPVTPIVDFIHRTAYDFLVDTEAGQTILSYGQMSLTAALFHMVRAYMAMARLVHERTGESLSYIFMLETLVTLLPEVYDGSSGRSEIRHILHLMQNFDQKNYLQWTSSVIRIPKPTVLSVMASYEGLQDFVLQQLRALSPQMATKILNSIFLWRTRVPNESIQALLSAGADPHAPFMTITINVDSRKPFIVDQRTAFWAQMMSYARLEARFRREPQPADLEALLTMAETCRDFGERLIMPPPRHSLDEGRIVHGFGWEWFNIRHKFPGTFFAAEANLHFMFERTFRLMTAKLPVLEPDILSRVQQIRTRYTGSFAAVRLVFSLQWNEDIESARFYEILPDHPIQDAFLQLCDSNDLGKDLVNTEVYAEWENCLSKITREGTGTGVIERDLDFLTQKLSKEFGFVTWEESGLTLPTNWRPRGP
ncbi:hypothetical protein B0I35DRAFT_192971 [Stachybotrys elegans]|uniref:NACHT domain-containing protein n=1 Tax=Stachybotrys elegans TaxID=80388 RepID=A0A8K0WTA9_9HYPO|nr:hypothetical protein B0I35DRAFT_192971 [Stachybotrys elegans]